MRIGIDIRYLSHGIVGGVQTYVRNFVPALIDLARTHEILLYADSKRALDLPTPPPNVTLRIQPWQNPLSSVRDDLLLWRSMARDHLDVAHFPANYGFGPRGARTVLTLHDSINILPLREIIRGHPKRPKTIAMMAYLHILSVAAVKRADTIITVSGHAARDIAQRGNVAASKIIPIHHGPPPDVTRTSDAAQLDDLRRRHRLHGGIVLADAFKNPAVLVQAWRAVPDAIRASHQLVFFARRPDVPTSVAEAAASGEATLLLRPSRSDLIALYSIADAFVFPSWIEGFGIPLLEAMTCGAPVIASDRGSIPEVVSDAALLADAEDAATFTSHLVRVLGDANEAARLRQLGYRRAQEFSWTRTAQAILDVYDRAVSTRPALQRVVYAR